MNMTIYENSVYIKYQEGILAHSNLHVHNILLGCEDEIGGGKTYCWNFDSQFSHGTVSQGIGTGS